MIYFVLVASVLAVQNGAVLEMTGDAAKIEFGGALTLIHNTTEDELVCSGKIKATDVLIEGTSTTVADLIGEVATLRQEMADVKQFIGMMPLSMPPSTPSPLSPPAPWQVCTSSIVGQTSSTSHNTNSASYRFVCEVSGRHNGNSGDGNWNLRFVNSVRFTFCDGESTTEYGTWASGTPTYTISTTADNPFVMIEYSTTNHCCQSSGSYLGSFRLQHLDGNWSSYAGSASGTLHTQPLGIGLAGAQVYHGQIVDGMRLRFQCEV